MARGKYQSNLKENLPEKYFSKCGLGSHLSLSTQELKQKNKTK